ITIRRTSGPAAKSGWRWREPGRIPRGTSGSSGCRRPGAKRKAGPPRSGTRLFAEPRRLPASSDAFSREHYSTFLGINDAPRLGASALPRAPCRPVSALEDELAANLDDARRSVGADERAENAGRDRNQADDGSEHARPLGDVVDRLVEVRMVEEIEE